MTIIFTCLIFSSNVLALFSLGSATSSHVGIGAIIDGTSRAGREANVSIRMALDDISSRTNQSFVLRIMDSLGDPATAALQAKRLIDSKEVQVILGPHTWREVSRVLEVGSRSNILTFSLADTTPLWATERWPFLVQASASAQDAQMKAVAAIVKSWDWHRVTIIYEDDDDAESAFGRFIPGILNSLREVGTEISQLIPLQPLITSSVTERLMELKRNQCRVFVVHTSQKLAIQLFQKAEEMQMMVKDYVWIVTNPLSDTLHSLNVTTISSMQGVLGVKKYFPETSLRFLEFQKRFRKKFYLENPDEKSEPGIFAVEAYDAMSVLARAMNGRDMEAASQVLKDLDNFSLVNGITGRVHFSERELSSSQIIEIVNVFGKSYRELGIWSEGLGFAKNTKAIYNSSMQHLGPVIWPGESSYTPKGWTLSNSTPSLRIVVPAEAMFKQFVKISHDPQTNSVSCTGYAIDIFNEVIAHLPYYVSYEFIPSSGTNDHLVEQVYLKNFDGVAGPVVATADRWGRLHSNLSRMAIVVWLFVALIITQCYTASLTSMLTVHQLEPKVSDIETLKTHNAVVGYGTGAFVAKYLEEVLGFKSENIKNYSTPEEYAHALKTGQIAAGFLQGFAAKLFLSKYCKSFTVAGPTYKVGGFGFAFPRGSPMIADVNKALLEVFESGKLRELEDKMIGSERCVEVDTSNDDELSLSLNSFWLLFALTVGTTTCALTIYTLHGLRLKRRFSGKVSDVEMSEGPPIVSS